jgi:hypothetical protein
MSPVCTVSPARTFTARTLPLTSNDSGCWSRGSQRPLKSSTCSTVPRCTVYVGRADAAVVGIGVGCACCSSGAAPFASVHAERRSSERSNKL